MNKEELTKEDILNVTGSIFETMFDYADNSNKEIEQLQQENKQLKENWNNLKKEIRFARKISLPVSPYTVGQLDILIHKMNCMESE